MLGPFSETRGVVWIGLLAATHFAALELSEATENDALRDQAIERLHAFIAFLPSSDPDRPTVVNQLAGAYVNCGIAKQASRSHGPDAAIADYDAAIALMEALRRDRCLLGRARRPAQ